MTDIHKHYTLNPVPNESMSQMCVCVELDMKLRETLFSTLSKLDLYKWNSLSLGYQMTSYYTLSHTILSFILSI